MVNNAIPSLKPNIYSIMIMGDIMFKNKKILILGMARSGYQAAKYLKKRGNEVILNDGGSEENRILIKYRN